METKLSVGKDMSTPELDHEFKFIDLKIIRHIERVAVVSGCKVNLKTCYLN